PYALAERDSALSSHHHPGRRWITAAVGKSRIEQGDHDRGVAVAMARPTLPDMSPWRRRTLSIPPDSRAAWVRLAVWEAWMGMLLAAAASFGLRLIATARDNIVTVYDFSRCYASPPIAMPCERIAYKAGTMNALFNAWCGVLLFVVAAWLVWELWNAVAPKPI